MAEASRSLTSTGYSHYGHTVSAFLEEGISKDNPDITYNLGNDIFLETSRGNKEFLPLVSKLMNEGKSSTFVIFSTYIMA